MSREKFILSFGLLVLLLLSQACSVKDKGQEPTVCLFSPFWSYAASTESDVHVQVTFYYDHRPNLVTMSYGVEYYSDCDYVKKEDSLYIYKVDDLVVKARLHDNDNALDATFVQKDNLQCDLTITGDSSPVMW